MPRKRSMISLCLYMDHLIVSVHGPLCRESWCKFRVKCGHGSIAKDFPTAISMGMFSSRPNSSTVIATKVYMTRQLCVVVTCAYICSFNMKTFEAIPSIRIKAFTKIKWDCLILKVVITVQVRRHLYIKRAFDTVFINFLIVGWCPSIPLMDQITERWDW